MIDYFAIGLTHALLALAAWRLAMRADLDNQPARRTRPGQMRHGADTGPRDDA
ncbi:hypothetical protein [Croceicoccus estronivorus]|uniref:hypothetical protein n=1 Tax=Croceicoccus estronivorus TaxID=1172626 RepID=UPI001478507D|nr:hypothetical protein [Croceicoccus estronivorus]